MKSHKLKPLLSFPVLRCSVESTTSTAPSSAPTVTGFCLKAITSGVSNKDHHIRVTSPSTNLITEAPTGSNFGLFDLDISTGKMSISGGTWAGYEVYALPPYDNQALRVIRFTNRPVEYPLRCSNPDGVYVIGSVLKCEVSAPWADSVVRRYALWSSSNSSPVGPWSIMRDDYVRAGSYNYDVGMFFGDDCSAVGGANDDGLREIVKCRYGLVMVILEASFAIVVVFFFFFLCCVEVPWNCLTEMAGARYCYAAGEVDMWP